MAPPDPSVTRIDGPWRHLDVHANGIRFHVVEAVPTDRDAATPPMVRPLVILLHGFASFWWSWRHQLRGLAGARVVALDLRGYGGSDKPPRGYDLVTAAADAAGLIRALGEANAIVIGHGLGGLIAWTLAAYYPKVVRRLAVISMAHPLRMRAAVLALFGYLKVRRIRGPRQTIESVKETRTALTPGHDKAGQQALTTSGGGVPADPSGW